MGGRMPSTRLVAKATVANRQPDRWGPLELRNGTLWKIVRHIEKVDTMRLFALFAIAVGLCHAQRAEGSFDRTLSVTGFVDLDLTTDAGGIRVTPGPPGTVRIHGILKAGDNWFTRGDVESRIRELEAHPPFEQNGNSVRVAVRSRTLLRGISMRLEGEAPRDSR